MTTIRDVIKHLETIAPPSLQESYDNARLLCGDVEAPVSGVVVSLDAIESVVDEAIATKANLIVSHHPIIFSGLKALTGTNYIERTIIRAIKHDIAIYAIHTNLDNVVPNGVNEILASKLGLHNCIPLKPDNRQVKFEIEISDLLKPDLMREVKTSLSYETTNFNTILDDTKGLIISGPPHISSTISNICETFNCSYRKMKVTDGQNPNIGAGLIGKLALPMTEVDFLAHVKETLNLQVIRHTRLLNKSIERVALCGGAGSFLLPQALRSRADVFVTADYKYHQFFDADNEIIIADVGHYESEQYTIDLLVELINGKFSTFAARSVSGSTNPVYYYI